MNSRQLVFKTSLIVRINVLQIGLSIISTICFLGLVGDLVAQSPLLAPFSGSSVPGIVEPVISQPTQPNLVPGTVVTGNGLSATPVNHDLALAAPKSAVESAQTPNYFRDQYEFFHREKYPVPIAEEINSIRRQLGGGLLQHFGSVTSADPKWEKSLEASFQNELNRLASQSASQSKTQSDLADAMKANVGQATGQNLQLPESNSISNSIVPLRPNCQSNGSTFSGSFGSVAFGNPGKVKPTGNRADQLRVAARALDQMASQFEASGMYEEADQVRSQAQKFWLKSRLFQDRSASR